MKIKKVFEFESVPQSVLFLDAHPSRRNKQLWRIFAKSSVDVITTVAHTTHVTQPLDRIVNARLKRMLQKLQKVPNKCSWSSEFESFVLSVEDALDEACLGKNIRCSFANVGLEPFDPEVVLSKVPECLGEDVIKKLEVVESCRNVFDINCKNLTDEITLQEWDEHDVNIKIERNKRAREKKLKKKIGEEDHDKLEIKKRKRKRKKVDDDIDNNFAEGVYGDSEEKDEVSAEDDEMEMIEEDNLTKGEELLIGTGKEVHFIMLKADAVPNYEDTETNDLFAKLEELENSRIKEEVNKITRQKELQKIYKEYQEKTLQTSTTTQSLPSNGEEDSQKKDESTKNIALFKKQKGVKKTGKRKTSQEYVILVEILCMNSHEICSSLSIKKFSYKMYFFCFSF
jgi:hypothetical protein